MWVLCFLNMGVILLLGGVMVGLSGNTAYLLLTVIMLCGAGSMIVFLLMALEKLKTTTTTQQFSVTAYEKAPLALVMVTPDLQFFCKNQQARETCWWLGNLPAALRDKGSQTALERLFKSVQQKTSATVSLSLRSSEGEEVWQIHTTPVEEGAVWSCSQKGVSETAKETSQTEIMTVLFEQSPEGVFSLNEKGIVVFCNTKFAEWLGYAPAEVVGLPFSKLLLNPRPKEISRPFDIQGRCELMTATSRGKTVYLDQVVLPHGGGFLTHSVASEGVSQGDLKKSFALLPFPAAYLDVNGMIQDMNPLLRDRLWPKEKVPEEACFLDYIADFQREDVEGLLQSLAKGNEKGVALDLQLSDGKESVVSAYLAPLSLKGGQGFFLQFHEVTGNTPYENQLSQSQKMQAVGQLAGGIAHDFNNLLTAMIGFCDLLLLRHTPGDQSFTDVMQIKQNANRAANLVRQLLAFSRQQKLKPKIMDVTETITELSAFLRRLLGATVELKIKHARDLGLILVDQGQFEQVITNLVVNARDALEGAGGVITLTTQNRDFKKAKRYGHDVIPAGSYVLVEVEDEGTGISPEIIDRIFDPFFSTKEVGSGTGLGLSTVYGIVKQTGGFIHVESTVGQGTVFSIFFPTYGGKLEDVKHADPRPKEVAPPHDLTGSHTILLVEDEDAVRLFSARALRSKGYTVIEAINGVEALEVMQAKRDKIDLVISDVVMPHMDGPVFVNEMNKLGDPPKVLFISGYTEDAFSEHFENEEEIHFLSKPFSLSDLAVQVKAILG